MPEPASDLTPPGAPAALTLVTDAAEGLAVQSRGQFRLALERFSHHRLAVAGLLVFVFLVLLSTIGPVFWQYSYSAITGQFASGPSAQHPFGTDLIGHDLFAQVMEAEATSVKTAALVAVIATTVGTVIGAIAGYLVLGLTDFGPQFPGALFQPVARLHHGTVLRAELRLNIGIHGMIDRSGGEQRIARSEGYLKHVRRLHGVDDQRILDCRQRGIARRIELRTDDVRRRRVLGGNQSLKDAAPPGLWSQFSVEFGIGIEVQPGCDLLDHRHATQHLSL